MGILRKKVRTIYNYKNCIAVDLILKHNQTGTILGRVRCMLFIQLIWSIPLTSHEECHRRLHYDRKFQIFIFLIGYINVNKGVFCLIISYLRIKSYNVLNYNICSTDWSFPLIQSSTLAVVWWLTDSENWFGPVTFAKCFQ